MLDVTSVKIGQAAKILGVSVKTLRRWENSGKISSVRTPGGTRLYALEDLPKINPPPADLISIDQAAKTLGVSTRTLRRWNQEGKINFQKDASGKILYSPKTIDNLSQDTSKDINLLPLPSPKLNWSWNLTVSLVGILSLISLLSLSLLFLKSINLPSSNQVLGVNSKANVFQRIASFFSPAEQPTVEDSIDKISSRQNIVEQKVSQVSQTINNLKDSLSQAVSQVETLNTNLTGFEQETGKIISTTTFNLLRNSSFESNISGQPDWWSYLNESTSDNTFVNNSSVRSGNMALRIKPTGSATNFGIYQPSATTVANHTYTLSLYIRNESEQSPTLKLSFWDKNNNRKAVSKEFSLDNIKDWKRYSFTLDPTQQGVDGNNFYPMIEVLGLSSGNVYLDDVDLSEGVGTSTYDQENLTIGDGSVTISVNGNIYPTTLRTGSIGLLGSPFNSLFLTKASIDDNGNTSIGGNLTVSGSGTITSNLAINGGTLSTSSTTFKLLNDTATTLNIGGAATTITLGASSSTTTINNNLAVSGTTTFTNSTTFSGNLGIGFTSPDRLIQIASDINITSSNAALLGAAGTQFSITGSSGTGGTEKKLVLGLDTTDNYGVIQAGNTSGTNYNLSLNPAGGNVGIGTTWPVGKLEVVGTFAVTGDVADTEGTGGTITQSGGYTIHTFTTSGTFHPGKNMSSVEVLVVGGGGSGGGSQGTSIGSGGGGAGGLIYNASYGVTNQDYSVTVGSGGTGVSGFVAGNKGQNSVFGTLTAVGGGYGGTWTIAPTVGGSGGGAGENGQSLDGAAGTANQGNAGGNDNGYDSGTPSAGGGGGGAGSVGSDSTTNTVGGAGGVGLAYSISGSSVFYAGGGGGAGSTTLGSGGNGGGGNGKGVTTGTGTAGTTNTGGGGGGSLTNANEAAQPGGNGGSGIVIVRYLTTSPSNSVRTNLFYVNSSTGNVGIGTTSPSQVFQVNPSGSSAFVVTSAGPGSGNGGNVGIGWTSPIYNLTFAGTSNQTIGVMNQQTANTVGATLTLQGATGNGTGNGGPIALTAGAAGSTSTCCGIGGAVTVKGGAGSSGSGGGSGGAVTITGGDAVANNQGGGAVNITGGVGMPGGGGTGGALVLAGGAGGTTNGIGGAITLTSGGVSSSNATGAITIKSANGCNCGSAGSGSGALIFQSGTTGTATTGTGFTTGTVTIGSGAGGAASGAGGVGAASGALTISTGNGGAATNASSGVGGAAGAITITAGNGGNSTGSTGGAAGTISLTAGNAGTGGNVNGGSIYLVGGTSTGTGLTGNVVLGVSSTGTIRGNVGIGASSPVTTLQIGTALGLAGKLLSFSTSTGNLGIGTTTPGSTLGVAGNVGIGVSFANSSTPSNGLAVQGNLGIGTTTANSNLSVIGNAAIGSNYGTYTAPTNGLLVEGNVGIGYSAPRGPLQIGPTPATPYFLVNSNGNVGIGGTTPGGKLEIAGTNQLNAAITDSGNHGASLFLNATNSGVGSGGELLFGGMGNTKWFAAIKGNSSDGSNNSVGFLAFSTRNITTDSTLTERMRIAATGNIGIGTAAVQSRLGVAGNAAIGSNYGAVAAPTNGLIVEGNVGIGTSFPSQRFQVNTNASNPVVITSGGNVGIGTTFPTAKLGVTGNVGIGVSFGFNAAVPVNGLAVEGNVGIGTTSPLQALHVVGQCVTGDSQLVTEDGQAIRVDQVKAGMKVYTLDQQTGKFVPAQINALLDMGIKPVFRLTTKSGKSIRTTGNHPYLVQISERPVEESSPIKGAGWVKVSNLQVGDQIAVASKLMSGSFAQSGISNNSNSQQHNSANNIESFQGTNSDIHFLSPFAKNKLKSNDNSAPSKPNIKPNNPTLSTSVNKGVITEATKTNPRLPQNSESLSSWLSVSSPANNSLIQDNSSTASDAYQWPVSRSLLDQRSLGEVGDVGWDPIVSIEYSGEEQVWDLAIEGTHNFVANDIVAHNTYINGNLGIGFTSPDRLTQIASDINITSTNASLLGAAGTQFAITGSSGTGGTEKKLVLGIDTTDNYGVIQAGNTSGTNYDLSLNPAGGNVGIGTTSPAALFQVGSAAGDGSNPALIVTLGGNVGIGTSSTANPLTVGTSGTNGNAAFLSAGGLWTNASSREFKENFLSLNNAEILDKINQLEVLQWNYKLENSSTLHIGPIAEEFYQIFKVGNDPKHISTIDPAGVALLGIQALSQKIASDEAKLNLIKLDSDGNLAVPKFKADKILLTDNVGIGGTNPDSLLSYDFAQTDLASNNSTNNNTSFNNSAVDLLASLKNLDQALSSLQSTTDSLQTKEATNSADIAELRSKIEQLGSKQATSAAELNLTPPDILYATGSAQLTNLTTSEATVSGMLGSYDLKVSNSLKSFGLTTLAKTNVAGDFTVDGTLSISGNSLTSIGTLYLQDSSLASSLDIFAGKVNIDKNGNIQTQGEVKAASITTNKLTISNQNIASSSATLATTIGTGTIPAGQVGVNISTPQASSTTKIFVTPRAKIGSQALVVDSVTDGSGFTVSLDHSLTEDVKFDWWIVESN